VIILEETRKEVGVQGLASGAVDLLSGCSAGLDWALGLAAVG